MRPTIYPMMMMEEHFEDMLSILRPISNQKVKFEIEDNSAVSKATFALMDTTKLKDLGWKPLYTVCQGLKETYTIKQQENTDSTRR